MNDSSLIPSTDPSITNVVELEQKRPDHSTADFEKCLELHSYWNALRGLRQMPARSEFDPREIETALANTFVAEKVAPSVARIRVAGSLLNDVLGMDVRGMPISALFDPASRDALGEATRDLFSSPAMAVFELTARRGFNLHPMKARLLLLPMSDADGQVSRLVGCLDIAGGLGNTPRRFKIASMRRTDIKGEPPQPTRMDTELKKPEAVTSYAFAETPAPFQHLDAAVKEPVVLLHKLRLVVDNS